MIEHLLDIYLYITFALFGLFTGSFLNVCIYRIPRGNFFGNNRSFCPQCRTSLNWYELIPVVSYIFLKARCRTCKERISIRYPLVEATNMILWILVYAIFGLSVYTVLTGILFSVLLVMSMIDYDIKEIPNGIIVIILSIGIISYILDIASGDFVWWDKVLGMFIMSAPFLLIGILTGGIGGGDIKLLFAMGAFLGWQLIILGGLIGILIGGIIGVCLLVFKKAGRKTEMPLGPSLAMGFVIATLWGNTILDWYISLI